MFEQSPVGRRLALCADALALRERLAAAPESAKRKARILVNARLPSIRKTLTGHASASLLDELLSPSTGYAALRGALDEVKDGTAGQKFEVAARVRATYALLRRLQIAEQDTGTGGVTVQGDQQIADTCTEWLRDADPLVNEQIYRGEFGYELKVKAQAAAALPEAHAILPDPDLSAKSEAIAAKVIEFGRSVRDKFGEEARATLAWWGHQIRGAQKGDIKSIDFCAGLIQDAEGKPWEAAFAEYRRIVLEEKIPAEDAIDAARVAAAEAAKAPRREVGQKAIDDVMAASAITEDEATAWANAQEITPTAAARLKKMKYPPEQVRRDMAEFYRFTGGRVVSVKINSKGDRRANATYVGSVEEIGTVNIDGDFCKRVLWHELAHHIEADPVAQEAARRLIRRRAEDDGATHSLRKLTGSSKYDADEIAYKDGFFSPYVGKVYSWGTTEVFSMGVESFTDPEELARRMASDPETLEFVSGFLKAQPSPMLKAFLSLQDTLRGMVEQEREQAGDSVEAMISKIAAGVSVRLTGDDSGLPEWAKHCIQRNGYKLAGFFRESHAESVLMLTGRVRNWDTKRSVSGLILAIAGRREGGREFFEALGHLPGKNTDLAKAAYAIYARRGHAPDQRDMQSEKFLSEYAK